eukprot:m.49205 g.49205  ORF g.49205 m.49205 type:complete len:57 (-) comp6095_c0_seq2:281-451(-)
MIDLLQAMQDNAGPMADDMPDPTDLRREAAYNLSLIYRASGADSLAAAVLAQYCTI